MKQRRKTPKTIITNLIIDYLNANLSEEDLKALLGDELSPLTKAEDFETKVQEWLLLYNSGSSNLQQDIVFYVFVSLIDWDYIKRYLENKK